MRVFWLAIIVLALATAGMLIAQKSNAPKGRPSPIELPPAELAPPPPDPPPDPAPAPAQVEPAAPVTPPVQKAIINDLDRAISGLSEERGPSLGGVPSIAAPTPAPVTPVEAPAAKVDASEVAKVTPVASGSAPAAPEKAKLEPQDDGWTRVDDRFLVRGAGTAEDPYLIPWDLLVSASESYRPRMGRKVMPDRITMLHGKHVRVTGFVLFPMLTQETKELLLMRSQWDGCCIGVPPTPYDAVEVKLVEAATRQDTFVQYATLEGVLKVEPYVNRDWLLGLYVLEDTRLVKISDEGVKKPTHEQGQHPGGSPS